MMVDRWERRRRLRTEMAWLRAGAVLSAGTSLVAADADWLILATVGFVATLTCLRLHLQRRDQLEGMKHDSTYRDHQGRNW